MSQQLCIFCDKAGLSKEHIWSKWMHKHFEDGLPITYEATHTDLTQKNIVLEDAERQLSGTILTKKIRAVCKRCNNGWMSKVEIEAKPILEKLFKLEPVSITEEEMCSVVNWVTMKSIVCEFGNSESAVTPFKYRNEFFLNRIIPEFTSVYLGFSMPRLTPSMIRYSCTLAKGRSGPKSDVIELPKNTQTILLSFGILVIVIATCREPDIEIGGLLGFNKILHPIFPGKGLVFYWPPKKYHNAASVNKIAYALGEYTSQDSIGWRP